MIRVAIVEDKASEANAMQGFLKRYEDEVGEEIRAAHFKSADLFLYEYKCEYDLVFMDIDMPGTDGITAAKKLRELDKNIYIIFVTNLAKYAIKGYEVEALDYFIKPAYYYDIKLRLDRVRRLMKNNEIFIVLDTSTGVRRIPVNEIAYVESCNHVMYYHTFKETYFVRGKSLKQVEDELAEFGFSRCNSGYLVNLKHCTKIDKIFVTVGGEQLQVSRARRKQFIEALMKSFRPWGGGAK